MYGSPVVRLPSRNRRSGVVELVGRNRLLFAKVEIGLTCFKKNARKKPFSGFWPAAEMRRNQFEKAISPPGAGIFIFFWPPRKSQL